MKRVYIAAVLLLLCFGMCIFFNISVDKKCKTLSSLITSALTSADSGDMALAAHKAESAEKLWEKYHSSFSMLITHSHFDELDEYIKMMKYYGDKNKKAEFSENCSMAVYELSHLRRTQKPDAENIF